MSETMTTTTTPTTKHQQLIDEEQSAANRSWFEETEADEQKTMAVSI